MHQLHIEMDYICIIYDKNRLSTHINNPNFKVLGINFENSNKKSSDLPSSLDIFKIVFQIF